MKAKIIHLDTRAIDYIQAELQATNHLGRAVLSSIELSRGSAVAVVPELHAPDAYAFRSGIFVRRGQDRTPVAGGYVEAVPSTEGAVAEWVYGVLGAQSRRVIVCESYLLRAADLRRASKLPRRTVAGGDFVYHWAMHDDPKQDVADVVRMAYPVPLGFAVICTLAVDPLAVLGRATIDPGGVPTIAASTECILLGAYDGESVLLWMRDGAQFRVSGVNLN